MIMSQSQRNTTEDLKETWNAQIILEAPGRALNTWTALLPVLGPEITPRGINLYSLDTGSDILLGHLLQIFH